MKMKTCRLYVDIKLRILRAVTSRLYIMFRPQLSKQLFEPHLLS
jgi:hypothetical protein